MPMFRLKDARLEPQDVSTFRDLNLYERGDLQRLLRAQPEVLGEELLVISEEFGDWQDSHRRIDLLALDDTGRLVVVELKRTEDGGHMELQALRYAAMVSSMSVDELVRTHASHHANLSEGDGDLSSSREAIADFLGTDADEMSLSSDVRIILVSADFGREITTAVLWLNRFEGMDIRCIRLKPYSVDGHVLIDIDQIIPLPEAASYQVQIGRKDLARARSRSGDNRDFTKYVIIGDDQESRVLNKRRAILAMVHALFERGVTVDQMKAVLPDRMFRSVTGTIEPGEPVAQALRLVSPDLDVKRYFVEAPLHERGETHVLFKMWGANTETGLNSLMTLAGDTPLSYRRVAQA